MDAYTDDERMAARQWMTRVVDNLVKSAPGDDAKFYKKPAYPGASHMVSEPMPLAALRTARLLEGNARQMKVDAAIAARGAGASWMTIAEYLGLTDRDDEFDDPAVEAFLQIAPKPSMRYDTVLVRWTCTSCGQRVTDTGPYASHPADVEQGHADGCARFEADVEEHRRRWDEDDDSPHLRIVTDDEGTS